MKTKKILNICLILASGFLYWVASRLAELIFDGFNIAITRDYWLTVPEMIALALAVLAYAFVIKNRTAVVFLTEAITELSKVTFPTKKESGQSAVVVMILVGIAALFLALFDLAWSTATQFILSY